MENMMPQLNSVNRTVQQIQASRQSGKSGKASQRDRFRDLLQNSPGKNSSKEMTAENRPSDEKPVKTESAGKTDKQQNSEAPEKMKEKPVENGGREDVVPVDETLAETAAVQMFPFLMENNPVTLQMAAVADAGISTENMPEVPQISHSPILAGSEAAAGTQTVLEAEPLNQRENAGEAAGLTDGFAEVMQQAQTAEVLPADHQASKMSLQQGQEKNVEATEVPGQLQPEQTAVQQTEAPARQESGQSWEDRGEEAGQTDSLFYSAQQMMRQDPAAGQIQETAGSQQPVHIRAGNTQELMDQLTQQLREKISVGRQEFEIQIHPENLGKLAIKVAYAAEKVTISIVCSNEKTMEALSAGAREIAQIMEKNLGTPATVVVDHQEENYLEQYKEQDHSRQQQQQEQKKEQEHTSEDSQDFLQQLRLGLI